MKEGIIKCSDCGHGFYGSLGGLMTAQEYACEACDEIKMIDRQEGLDETVCDECGGRSIPGLNRMCPVCKSRNTEMIRVIVLGD